MGPARQAYRRFLKDGLAHGHQGWFYETVNQRFLGDERFIEEADRRTATTREVSVRPWRAAFATLLTAVATAYDSERMNQQIWMGMRRFTKLTNAQSKKIENHRHALALYFMHYNFAQIHSTLRVTPAMQAEVADHVWSLEEIVGLIH